MTTPQLVAQDAPVAQAPFRYNGFDADCTKCGRYIATQQGVAYNFKTYCRSCIGQAIAGLVRLAG